MIRGKYPSIKSDSNSLIVSKVDDSTFTISEGVVCMGGNIIFFEKESFRCDVGFPFRIGIEVEGVPTNKSDILTSFYAKAGNTMEPPDIKSKDVYAPTPYDLSKLKPVPIGYNFDNRKFKNPFKSLAIVEKKLETVIVTQHTYGPLVFIPMLGSSYENDYVIFNKGNLADVQSIKIDNKLILL